MKSRTSIETVLQIASVVAILAMFGTVLLQIAGRHFLATAPSWTEELGRLLVVWLTAIGAGMALKTNGYRGAVEFFVALFPTTGKKLVNLVMMTFIGVFLLILSWQTFLVMQRNMDVRSSALNLPMSGFYLGVFVMAVLLLWALCHLILTEIRNRNGTSSSGPMGHVRDRED